MDKLTNPWTQGVRIFCAGEPAARAGLLERNLLRTGSEECGHVLVDLPTSLPVIRHGMAGAMDRNSAERLRSL